MKKTIATFVALLSAGLVHAAQPPLSHEAGMPIYDDALKAYMCVDYDKAFRLFLDNAEKGHALSQYMVGVMLGDGQGTDRDLKSSFEWFKRAAQQNQVDAHFALGDMYRKGEGVAADDNQALFWFDIARRGGHKLAGDRVQSLESALGGDQLAQIRQQVADWFTRMKP